LSQAAPQPRRRRRRTAEEARHAILEAAQRRLAECGPEEIRLQDIAADLGISHPAILHHFGSREALMRELSRHAFESLNADLLAALNEPTRDVTGWLDRVFETLRDRGHARLLAWGTLTGRLGASEESGDSEGSEEGGAEDDAHLLRDLAQAIHTRRESDAHRASTPLPRFEETVFAVRLVSAALLGDALIGGVLRRSAGVSGDEATRERYRGWLAAQVTALLLPARARDSRDRG
jgi:AcrR family transcriptional regulator